MHLTVCAQCNVIITSEFVYIQVKIHCIVIDRALKLWRSHLKLKLASRPKIAILSTNFKNRYRLIVSMTVSNFALKICHLLTIVH